MSEARVMPLADVNAIYERDMSRYPDRIRVAMEDGQVVYYRIDDRQMHPSLAAALNSLIRIRPSGEGRHEKNDRGAAGTAPRSETGDLTRKL